MPRIAVIGSCITRDLWPIFGGGAQNLLYISRTSLASVVSSPVEGLLPHAILPPGMHQHQHVAVLADLQKTALARLVAFQPTHIIFDFIDERFDLLSVGGAIVTHSAELEDSGYLAQPALAGARPIPRLSEACERIWLEAAAEFAALVRGTPLRRARLILHAARWATAQRTAEGRTAPLRDVAILRPVEIGPYNEQLARYEAAFQALMPSLDRIDVAGLRLADPAHRWGLSPFHYIPEYYAALRQRIEALGLGDAFSDPVAAPSVPAA